MILTRREALVITLVVILGSGFIGAAIGRVTGPEHTMTVRQYEALICAPIAHDEMPAPAPARKEIEL